MDNLKLSPICTSGTNTSEKTNVTLPFEDEKTEAQKDDIGPPRSYGKLSGKARIRT